MAITAKILYMYGYNKNSLSAVNFIRIYNSGTSDEYFNSIKVFMGVPKAGANLWDPNHVVGAGTPCEIKLTCGGQTVTKTIDKIVSAKNKIPVYTDCKEYTFTFNEYIKIPAGSNVTIKLTKSSNQTTLIFDHFRYGDNSTTATSKVYPKEKINLLDGWVYIYTDDGWKPAIPYVCTAVASDGKGTWKQAIPYVCTAVAADGTGTWKKCGN